MKGCLLTLSSFHILFLLLTFCQNIKSNMSGNEEFLKTAIEAAKKAGSHIIESFHGEKSVSFKGRTDLVTEVDRKCEEIIIQTLKEKYPDHTFLGEEVSHFYMINNKFYINVLECI